MYQIFQPLKGLLLLYKYELKIRYTYQLKVTRGEKKVCVMCIETRKTFQYRKAGFSILEPNFLLGVQSISLGRCRATHDKSPQLASAAACGFKHYIYGVSFVVN